MIEQGMRLLSMKSSASKSKSSARVERKSGVRRMDQTYGALYYPFIHFKDDRWLKLSALFWDRIGRIVPTGYITQDSPTVTGLNSVVTKLAPSLADPAFGKPFIEFIHEYAPTLQQKYAVVKCDTWKCLPKEIRPPINGGPSGDDRRLLYIYYEKIPPDLYEALQKSGLALIDCRGPPWIGMHPDLASVYMTALAEHIAVEQRRQFTVVWAPRRRQEPPCGSVLILSPMWFTKIDGASLAAICSGPSALRGPSVCQSAIHRANMRAGKDPPRFPQASCLASENMVNFMRYRT
jgi:hypothetical protein